MAGLSRRTFLTSAVGVAAAGVASSRFGALAAPPPKPNGGAVDLVGQWPRAGGDLRNTCFQPLPGGIRRPGVAARTYLGGSTAWVSAHDLDGDGNLELIYITGGRVIAMNADLTERWSVDKLGPLDVFGVFDLAGDGNLQVIVLGLTTVYALNGPDGKIVWQHNFGSAGYVYSKTVQIGHIDTSKAGLQMVVWPYYDSYGYAFAFDRGVGSGYQMWQTSPAYDNPAYLPELMLADVDGDGQTELVIAGYHEVTAFAGSTGARKTGGTWNGHVDWETGPDIDGRNYGNIYLIDLDGDDLMEVVDLSDSVTLHAAVVENDPSGFSVRWDKFIEYTENHKALRSTINSVRDVDGDGRVEIVCALYNDTGDSRWHLLVVDALDGFGTPKLDLPDRYLRGVQDFDGDGKAELLVTVEKEQTPGSSSTVELYAVGADGTYEVVWSLPSAHVVLDPHTPFTPNIGAGSRNGQNEVLRADPVASFVVVAGETLQGYTYKDGSVTQSWSRAYDGGVLHRVVELTGPGSAAVLYQDVNGYLRLEKADGTLIAQTQLAGLSGMATVARLAGSKANSICVPGFGRVRVYDYKSRRLTLRWAMPGQGEYVYAQTLEAVPAADLNADGTLELVFVDSLDDHTRMRVVDGASRVVWDHTFPDLPAPTLAGPNGAYLWTFGDFSGHDGLDVYVGANRAGYNTEVSRILNGRNGALLAARDDGPGHVGAEFGPWVGAPAVYDIDGDGIDNTILLAADVTYDINGANLAGVKILDGHVGLYHTPIIADVDGDGAPEILMTAGFNYMDAIDLDSAGAGTSLWRVDTEPAQFFGRRSAVADVDGDGQLELATLAANGDLTCWNAATGTAKWSFKVPNAVIAPNVIAVDIDGDGNVEWVVGAQDGTIYAIDGRADIEDRVKWSLALGRRLGDIIAADVDDDGRSELVVTAEDGYLYVIDDAKGNRPA
jgi:hypothetical protein